MAIKIGVLKVFLGMSLFLQILARPEDTNFTPVPFTDFIADLRPLFFGSQSDYFISMRPMDQRSARAVCQNLTTLTGKHFHLLMLESKDEVNELQSYVESQEGISGLWVGGEKTLNDHGEIGLWWVTEEGKQSMTFRNFREGAPLRKRRSIDKEEEDSRNHVTSLLYPWLNVKEGKGGRCRNGRYVPPECEPVECNVTMPDCTTITPPCIIKDQSNCTVQRPDCSAKCENCTVVPPVCYVQPQPCTVQTPDCWVINPPCSEDDIVRPNCTTTRPPCKTIQPPCEVTTPPPCTTPRPCIPTFSKNNCTTVTPPCTVNKKNETICPPARTECQPEIKCEPVVCQSPPLICPPPLTYCEPETTICHEPVLNCSSKPALYCPPPIVDCPEPIASCTRPSVQCSAPVVNCGQIVTNCNAPNIECPPPIVDCPAPIIECTKPPPCEPPVFPPPDCSEPTTTTPTTTQRPCPGCGCVFMSKEHEFQWDIDTCSQEYHFICEG